MFRVRNKDYYYYYCKFSTNINDFELLRTDNKFKYLYSM